MNFSHVLLPSLIRGTDLLGMILLIGDLVFKIFVAPPAAKENSRLSLILPFFLLLTGICDLTLRSQMISSRPLTEVWGFLPLVLFKTQFGKVWMLRTFLLCLLGAASAIHIKSPGKSTHSLALIAGTGLLLTASLSGHAADLGVTSWAVVADWFHLIAVSAWVGGLFFLGSLIKQRMTSSTSDRTSETVVPCIQRFSKIAGLSVALLLITGGYQAWRQTGSLAALLETPYGRTLIVKLMLVLPLFGLGALNRYYFLPRLRQHIFSESLALSGKTVRHLFNSVRLELGLALGVIAAAALLTQLPPAKSQLASVGTYGASTHLGHGQEGRSQPAAAEGASVKILSPKEGQVFRSDEIPVHFEFIKGKRGHHIHAYVDGELMGMFESEKGTLAGIPPGNHVLEARVVADDHATELDATDNRRFVVEPKKNQQ